MTGRVSGIYKEWNLRTDLSTSYREELLVCLQKQSSEKDPVLAALFDDLDSANEAIADDAKNTLLFLLICNISLEELIQRSLPILPLNLDEMLRIISTQSESSSSYARERALIACSHLTKKESLNEGFEIAGAVASKKLGSSDVKVQKDGFTYFCLLLGQQHPALSDAVLLRVREMEKELFSSDEFEVQIVENETLSQTYPSSQLEAAIQGCQSKEKHLRDHALILFGQLLNVWPETSIDAAIEGILLESKRLDPCLSVLNRIGELTGYTSGLSDAFEAVVRERWKTNSPLLLEALDNLSLSGTNYMKRVTKELKRHVKESLERGHLGSTSQKSGTLWQKV